MDPGLRELINQGEGPEEVEVILRLRDQDIVPPEVRVVTRLGDIATGRLQRNRIAETWADEAVLSLKAPRLVAPEPALMAGEAGLGLEAQLSDSRRPPPLAATGQGVVVGVVDWGCDFAHPNFRHPDDSSRLLALWDQSNTTAPEKAAPYGYGAVFSQADINRALANSNPYEALGYHPARADPAGRGAHGTHVLDIAAGNGRAGGPVGVAPEADLVFVHLAARGVSGLANLGDSVRILEALDFVARLAGDRPWVINLSIGRCGGPHTGLTKVERGIDALLLQAPGRAIAQSTGNYFGELTHAADQLGPGQKRTLTWWTDQADFTPNELEVWYSGRDRLIAELRPPQSDLVVRVPLGEQAAIQIGAQEVGRIYHRARDPDRGDHHLDIFLDPAAPAGEWRVTLIGDDIVDGRFHAWVERDAACLGCQSRFDPDDAVPFSTTGTICNGFRTLAVGAYNPHAPDWPLAPFSSAGPTIDGRYRPHLVAPGVSVLAARSASPEPQIDAPLLTRKSGTSMAAPHVTGTVACMFQVAQRPLWIHETHRLLLNSTRRVSGPEELAGRIGNGYLDTERAVEAARQLAAVQEHPARLTLAGVSPVNELKEEVRMNSESEERLHDAESLAAENSDNGVSAGAGITDGREVSDLVETDHGLFEEEAEMESPALFEDGDEEMIDDEAYFETEDEHLASEALFDPGCESCPETEVADAWASADYYGDEVEEIVDEATAPYHEAYEPSLVEQVDEIISSGETCRSSGELLTQVLSIAGVTETLNPLGSAGDLTPLPALIFDALVPGGSPALRRRFEQFFEVVALPGESLLDVFPQPGDILLRRALAEGNLAHTALVVSEGMVSGQALRKNGLSAESGLEGSYSQVMETGPFPHPLREQFFRRMTDQTGRVPYDQMILRLRSELTPESVIREPDFVGPDELAFETLPQGPLGTLTSSGWHPLSYVFTPDDLLWTARFIVGETASRTDLNSQAVLWAMFNRFGLRRRSWTSFHGLLRTYSTPLQAPHFINWRAARRHMHNPNFVRTGGYYTDPHIPSGQQIPRGQLQRHLDIQQTPWERIPQGVRGLAERALTGQIPNPIGIATHFASTRIFFYDQHRRFPANEAEWIRFTEDFARGKNLVWIRPVQGLDQMGMNAFFVDRRDIMMPSPIVRVLPPATPEAPPSPASQTVRGSGSRMRSTGELIDLPAESPTGSWDPAPPNSIIIADSPVPAPAGLHVTQGTLKFTHRQIYPRRNLSNITQLVIHETGWMVCRGADRVARNLSHGTTASIHLIVDADGQVYQYGDLADTMRHSRRSHDNISVGIEVIRPVHNAPCALSYSQRLLRASWADRGAYRVPPRHQVEAVSRLIAWLTSNASGLAIPRQWIGANYRQDRPDQLPTPVSMAMHRVANTLNSRRPGIYAHTYWNHSDGAWPILYAWLRLEAQLCPYHAYTEAIRRAPRRQEPADLTNLPPPCRTSHESNENVIQTDIMDANLTQPSAENGQQCFPNGTCLSIVTGQPEGQNQTYWDPHSSGNPLLDTSSPYRSLPLSQDFTVDELARSGRRTFNLARIDPNLVSCLQRIRTAIGREVIITSGYRSWAYNVEVYRRDDAQPTLSRHCSGMAADIRVRGMSGLDIARVVIDACGCNIGLGIADDYAHVDVRGEWARWGYGSRAQQYVREIDAYRRQRCNARGTP